MEAAVSVLPFFCRVSVLMDWVVPTHSRQILKPIKRVSCRDSRRIVEQMVVVAVDHLLLFVVVLLAVVQSGEFRIERPLGGI